MAVTQEGEFFFEDRNLYGGIRQDLPSTARRYTTLKNVNLIRKRVLTKRKGTDALNDTAISGDPEILAGCDAHFSSGAQKLVLAAGTDAYVYNTTTKVFDAQSLALTGGATSLELFADELLLANGTEFKKYDGSSWSNVSGSPPVGNLLATHANRLIIAGRSTRPFEFYYTGVRNVDSTDTANDKVIVGGTSGDEITGLGTLGRWLFVATETACWVYLQSQTNPGDWDFIQLSDSVGVVSAKSVFEVSRQSVRMTLFWSLEGAMVAYQIGNQFGIKPLYNCIYKMVDGTTVGVLDGLEEERFSSVSGGYNPDLREACFGATKVGNAENDVQICYDLDSLVAYVTGEIDQPFCTVKDNGNSGVWPCDILMQVRVDSDNTLSTSGKQKFFSGRQGKLFRQEAPNTYVDDGGTLISMWVERDGYSGEEDGIAGYDKVANKARIEATQNGGFAATLIVSADNEAESEDQSLSLDEGLGLWGDGGIWTTDPNIGKWNATTITKVRGNYGVHGTNFKIAVADYGAIDNEFELSEISIDGYVYERQ